MSIEFILLIIVGIAGFAVQAKLSSVFTKYSKVTFSGGLTGAQVAEKMLRDNGIDDVKVTHVAGKLTDHYNPATKTVNLSDGVYNSNSVSAAAVAAHECGHAVQHEVGYAPLKLRSALVPVTSFSSKYAFIFLLAGILVMQSARFSGLAWVFWIGIGMLAIATLFSLVTLPVEYNASARALAWLDKTGTLSSQQHDQAKEALGWAARTYLVAAISSLVTLLYYIGLARRD